VEALAAPHGHARPPLEPGEAARGERTRQRRLDLAPGDEFAVADDPAVAGFSQSRGAAVEMLGTFGQRISGRWHGK
jgi:hypothetical protein